MNNEWDHIQSITATFEDWEDGKKIGERTYHGIQAWSMLAACHKPYGGVPKLKSLPASKYAYKALNPTGGRKAMFSQSKEYKRRNKLGNIKGCYNKYHWQSGVTKIATPWYGWKPNEPI